MMLRLMEVIKWMIRDASVSAGVVLNVLQKELRLQGVEVKLSLRWALRFLQDLNMSYGFNTQSKR